LVCAGDASSVPAAVALDAASLLALHPHDLASRPLLTFAPKTEHGRYILEIFALGATVGDPSVCCFSLLTLQP
jgi:hypothetical protein